MISKQEIKNLKVGDLFLKENFLEECNFVLVLKIINVTHKEVSFRAFNVNALRDEEDNVHYVNIYNLNQWTKIS